MKIVIIAGVAGSLINFRGPLIRTLVGMGHELIACAPEKDETLSRQLRDMGARYEPVDLQRTGFNPLRDFLSLCRLTFLLKRIKPDIVLSYTIKPVIYGSLAAFGARIPAIYSIITGLGYSFSDERRSRALVFGIIHKVYKAALSKNLTVFFQNPDDLQVFQEKSLISRSTRTVLINGSGVDLEHYAQVPHLGNSFVFLLIARLLKDKGIEEYVQAARILRRSFPEAKIQLLGRTEKHPLAVAREQIKRWTEEGVIEYLGSTKDVRPFLARATVYVLPSYREGTPRTVLEAMSVGRPIITTDVPGCRETVVNGENGYLVPAKNPEALAEAMKRFIRNPELIRIMGQRSREIAVEKYDVNKVNAVIVKTLGLLNNKRTV